MLSIDRLHVPVEVNVQRYICVQRYRTRTDRIISVVAVVRIKIGTPPPPPYRWKTYLNRISIEIDPSPGSISTGNSNLKNKMILTLIFLEVYHI